MNTLQNDGAVARSVYVRQPPFSSIWGDFDSLFFLIFRRLPVFFSVYAARSVFIQIFLIHID